MSNKTIDSTGLTKLITLIKSAFVKNADVSTLDIDTTPTSDSTHLVTSGGVYTAVSAKQDTISDLSTIRSNASSGASKISCTDETVGDFGYTKNTGTVTSVSVKMNETTKGTVTSTGTIDLGTVLTSHQDISGKENTSNKVTSISSSSTDTQYPSAKAVYDTYRTAAAQDTIDNGKLNTSQKGAAGGLAELDSAGKVPSAQLPSFVDDVLEYNSKSAFPSTGEAGKIYIAIDTNVTYRWSGSAYTEISASLALGETSSTAYRGDRGATAYTHSQLTSGNPHNVSKSDVGLGNVDNTSDANKPVSTAQATAINAKYTKPSTGIPKTDLASAVQTSLGLADTALQSHQDISGKENTSNKTTTLSSSSTDTQYPSAKAVYDTMINGVAIPEITLTSSQVTSASPVQIQLTEAQQTIIENENYAIIQVNANSIGFSNGYVLRYSVPNDGRASFIMTTTDAQYTLAYRYQTGIVTMTTYRLANESNEVHYIVGSSSDAAGTWTGTDSSITSYYDGLSVIFVPQVAGASTTTLNINSLGAKTCYQSNTNNLTTQFSAGTPILFTYYGGYWKRADYVNSNSYYTAYITTGAATAAKAASISVYALKEKTYIYATLRYTNSAQSALTLNIGSTGAKPIYINGAASSSTNYTLPAGNYLIYYDGTNYYFRTDGTIEYVETTANKTTTLTSSSTDIQYPSAKAVYDKNTSQDAAISRLGELMGSGTWNQIWNHRASGSSDDHGLTRTFSANNTVQISGTTTGTFARLTSLDSGYYPSIIQGHKYFLYLNTSGEKPVQMRVRTGTTAEGIATTTSEIFTASADAEAVHLRWSGTTGTEVDMTIQFWLCDLTVAFGSGNEPSTVAEMTAMFPNSYYPYCEAHKNYIAKAIRNLGELIASGTWNQLCKPYSTTTINGVTAINDGTNKITFSGTSTGTGNFYFLYNHVAVAGHKYYYTIGTLSVSASGSNLAVYNSTNSQMEAVHPLHATHDESGIFTAKYSGFMNYYVTFWSTGITFSGYIYPQFIDLTAAFGAGNEPTLDEMHAMFPNNYYPYCVNRLDQILSYNLDGLYEGVNLVDKFSSEISAYSDEWAWIKARINAKNFNGIHVNDYIPVVANSNTFKARIIGINTYKGYGNTAVANHIDWMFEELWPTRHVINKVNYNNGISTQKCSWLASDAYYWANSLSGSVPNATTVDPATVAVDYTADGIYYYLPQTLKNVIIQKLMIMPQRYSATGVLSNPNSWGWENIGKIWFPTECEVYGQGVWGTNGYEMGGSAVQYPYFASIMNRSKNRSSSRDAWWLLSVTSSSTTSWCYISTNGYANSYTTSGATIATPVCFRVG